MPDFLAELLQQIVNGLSLGAIYALIAVGYTMVYGVLRLINFAHGDVFMIGAVVAWYTVRLLIRAGGFEGGAPDSVGVQVLLVLVLLLVPIVVCGALGFTIERLAYRPLRNRSRLAALITAIGVSMLLEYGMQTEVSAGGAKYSLFGPTPQAMPTVFPWLENALPFESIVIIPIDLIVMGLTIVLMVGLSLTIKYTRMGMAIRAVSHRVDTAALMGISVNKVISQTFVLGSALAAVGGVLWAIKYTKVEPLMGLMPGIKAFVAAVLGGIGSIYGAVLGGLLLGLVEVLVAGFVEGGSQYRDGVAFVILIAVLLIKPSGLLGGSTHEKV
jgi:branched-chain amino acid transport system permease protein